MDIMIICILNLWCKNKTLNHPLKCLRSGTILFCYFCYYYQPLYTYTLFSYSMVHISNGDVIRSYFVLVLYILKYITYFCMAWINALALAIWAISRGCRDNRCATNENNTQDPKNPKRLKNAVREYSRSSSSVRNDMNIFRILERIMLKNIVDD